MDDGSVSYSISAVSENGTTVRAYIMDADGNFTKELPMTQVDPSTVSVKDGIYVHADIGWKNAESKIKASDLPPGTSHIALVLYRGETEKARTVSEDAMEGKATANGGSGENSAYTLNDMVGYACYVDDMSGLTFDLKKGKLFVTGYVYSSTDAPLADISYTIEDVSSAKSGAKFQTKLTRADAEDARDMVAGDFPLAKGNQGVFSFSPKFNVKKSGEGTFRITVTFLFGKNGSAGTESFTTTLKVTADGESGTTYTNANDVLAEMGYQ